MVVESFIETIYDVLFKPMTALSKLAEERPLGQAVVVLLISLIIPALGAYFVFSSAGFEKLRNFILITQTIGYFLLWFLGAAILHLIAEIYGGKGTVIGLLVTTGFANLPHLLAVPFLVGTIFIQSSVMNGLVALVSLVIFCWTLTLNVIALKEVYKISWAKAVLVLITPSMVIIALLIVFVILSLAAVLPERLL
ncbi:MAG: Yip1 protein [Firmicutes bacterium]|nr:Yip1 protein [Bacillota bacterium]